MADPHSGWEPTGGRSGWRAGVECLAVRRALAAASNRSYGSVPIAWADMQHPSRCWRTSGSLDWQPWVGSDLGEDVILELLCCAPGLRMSGPLRT